jgi:hypothetical protein
MTMAPQAKGKAHMVKPKGKPKPKAEAWVLMQRAKGNTDA